MTVPNIPRKLNIAPYPYRNKFCMPKFRDSKLDNNFAKLYFH